MTHSLESFKNRTVHGNIYALLNGMLLVQEDVNFIR